MALACTATPATSAPTPNIEATVEARLQATIAAMPTPTPIGLSPKDCLAVSNWKAAAQEYYFDLNENERLFNAGFEPWLDVLATSKSGTLLLRRDQGEMAVFWDSRSRRL